MTIQIDDAGWGCLLRGVLIGVYREETQEFACDEIPVAYFQGDAFEQRAYLDEAARIVEAMFGQLRVDKAEPIIVCTGYVLDGVRDWLTSARYNWRSGKIRGPLQERIETALLERLRELEVDLDYATLTEKQGLTFWKCLLWLKGGQNINAPVRPERARWAKTGWASWGVWSTIPNYQQAKTAAARLRAARQRARWEEAYA